MGLAIAPALLALGAWAAMASAAATAIGLMLVTLALYGIDPWRAFLAETVPYQAALLANSKGFFVSMLVSPYAAFRPLGVAHGSAIVAQSALAAGVVIACALAVRRTRDPDTRLLLVASATFLVTPYALTYDMPIIALVIARTYARAPRAAWALPQAFVLGSAWAAPLLSGPLTALGLPLTPLLLCTVFLGASLPLLKRYGRVFGLPRASHVDNG